jgi:hypothetical protein
VRLDHLLSKEHLASRLDRTFVPMVGDSRSMHWLLGGELTSSDALVRPTSGSGTRDGRPKAIRRAHCSALGVRALEHLENSIASASIYSQVSKGLRWMPWRQEPMKDASGCEKLRGAAEKAEIRRCPNGETRPGSCPVTQV